MESRLALLPLPTVLFPGVVMPVRLTDDHDRALVRDVMSPDTQPPLELGVVATKVGTEQGRGTVSRTMHRVGCSALLGDVDVRADGSFDTVVTGHRRFRVHTVDATGAYLSGEARWLDDVHDLDAPTPLDVDRIATEFDRYRSGVRTLRGDDVLDGPTPREPIDLSYSIAAALVIDPQTRQGLLEESSVRTRLLMASRLVAAELAAMRAVSSLPATRLAGTGWCPN